MTTKQASRTEPDYVLVMIIASLLAAGLLMVYSASFAMAAADGLPSGYYFWRQCGWAAVGLVGLAVMYLVDYHFWQRLAIPVLAATLLVLLAVLLFGDDLFGARRTLFNGHVQPSEMAKLTVIIYVAAWLASKGNKLQKASYGLIPFACLIGIVAALIGLEPDLSTSVLVVLVGLVMFFLGGADVRQLVISLAGTVGTFTLFIVISGYGHSRIREWMEAVRDPLIRDGTWTLTSGGATGKGLGDGIARWLRGAVLPHTDGIFSVLGEEAGLIGSLIVVALFAAFAYRGFRVAGRAPSQYAMLVAAGITIWLIAQALIHISVAVALVPVTGMTLPFMSYGGSSLVTCLAAAGLLLNISRQSGGEKRKEVIRREALDFRRGNRGSRLSPSDRRGDSAGHHAGRTRASGKGRPKSRTRHLSTDYRRRST